MSAYLVPLTFYHWLVGTIIVSFCSIEIFHKPNGPVLPFQLFGTLLSVAFFLFLHNNFVLRDEIYYCLGGSAVFYVISFFTTKSGPKPVENNKPAAKPTGKPGSK